ncbi:hypothetical protein GCM10009117_11790 [Gangjinia marincola]|uniref:Uncharacterized protein n=2 Tax=Gangjinia marincola TaxID=578463 RepID=A0ABP3XUP5_9FLAO
MLDVEATDKGILIPRLTTAQRDAITLPATYLIIFNTDELGLQFNFGTPQDPKWSTILSNAERGSRGSLNYNAPTPTSGQPTTFTGTTVNTGSPVIKKLDITTTASDLRDFVSTADNRLQYTGDVTRFFRVTYAVSFFASTNNVIWAFYVAKGDDEAVEPILLEDTKSYVLTTGTGNDITIPVVGSIELAPGDYIETWAERYQGGGNTNSTISLEVISLNLVID